MITYVTWRKLGFILGLVVAGVILFIPSQSLSTYSRITAGVACLMAIWWVSEAIKIWYTALIPLVIFPLSGVLNLKGTLACYLDLNLFLFLGGLLIAQAMQKWMLHKRIALNIIKKFGSSPNSLLLGFMCATAFISLWVSNTATTIMMYPIGLAVAYKLCEKEEKAKSFALALMLGIAYSASVGGIGTKVGTLPNAICTGFIKKWYNIDIDFLTWLYIGMPFVLIFLPIIWFYLSHFVMKKMDIKTGKVDIVREELTALGKTTKGEKMVLIIFIATALLWIFNKTIFSITGLKFKAAEGDALVAMLAGFVLFILPVNLKRNEFVLDWRWAKKMPWEILILLGGGIALAQGFESSGLSLWVCEILKGIGHLPDIGWIFLVSFLVIFLTEVTSNTALTTMILPILNSTALAIGFSNPLLLLIPATIAASCAFMLPSGTPPNAIVFGSGYVKIPQMAKIGFVLNIIGSIVITLLAYFWIRLFVL